jgi:5-formyltetrahydrofolate cyclo-ligase
MSLSDFPSDLLSDSLPDRKALRRALRQRRRDLSRPRRIAAAKRVAAVLARRPEFVSADNVAVYLAADGEIDTQRTIEWAWAAGKRVYLPVLQAGNRLRFAEYRRGAHLRRNRFGIPEPVVKRFRAAKCLDLVLMPLVGFDAAGGRLGMGGGFYDRTFAFLREQAKRRPALVGLAFGFQQVGALPVEPWDVPMAGVATDRGWCGAAWMRR